MIDDAVRGLTELRRRVEAITADHVRSLSQFHLETSLLEEKTNIIRLVGFASLLPPWGPSGRRATATQPSLSSTTTCVRSILHAYELSAKHKIVGDELLRRFSDRFAKQDLRSEKLPHLNVYTTALVLPVLRRLGADSNSDLIIQGVEVLKQQVNRPGVRLDDYPPNGYLTYWALRGLDDWSKPFGFDVRDIGEPAITWAEQEFLRQLTAPQESEQRNPFDLGYCLSALRRYRPGSLADGRDQLALRHLFDDQLPRGVWEKRHQLFDFEKGSAYPFSFELLSTLLLEYQDEPEALMPFDAHLERAFRWVERNRNPNAEHRGTDPPAWRSGNRQTDRLPESWATAEVFSFLHSYRRYLSRRIQDHLFRGLRARRNRHPDDKAFATESERFYLPDIPLPGRPAMDVVSLMRQRVLDPLKAEGRFSLTHAAHPDRHLRSGILFGPPGTGKTTLVCRMAEYLGWPMVDLDPSDFARGGLELVPAVITEIFNQLLDLEDTVIFFDEMEVFMPDRQQLEPGDVHPAVFTNSLLPKLQALNDRARCLFFLATNHVERMDKAATREGRFDFAIQIRPPSMREKLRMLKATTPEPIIAVIAKACDDVEIASRIEWATRKEALTFVDRLRLGSVPADAIRDRLSDFSPKLFEKRAALEREAEEYSAFPDG